MSFIAPFGASAQRRKWWRLQALGYQVTLEPAAA